MDQNDATQELVKNTMNTKPTRTVRASSTDCPSFTDRTSPSNPRSQLKLSIDGSPKPLDGLSPNFREMRKRLYEMLCLKSYGLKPTQTLGITNLANKGHHLEFIQSSPNRDRFPVFEGSRSSTKRHKALTHDPLKEVREKTANKSTNSNRQENHQK